MNGIEMGKKMIDKLIKPVSDILDKFVADNDLKLKLSHELEKEIVLKVE